MPQRPVVYFLCVGNAMRSQMAEAFLKRSAGDRFEVHSAGTHPLGHVLPEVLEVMAEVDHDLAEHFSCAIDPDLVQRADHIIDLGGRGRERIPAAYRHKYVHWQVEDPYGLPATSLRQVRDIIRDRVARFAETGDPRA